MAAFAEALPGGRGPSTGFPAKGQQGKRHSACLQKPRGNALQEMRKKGKDSVGFFGHFPAPEPAAPPLFRHRDRIPEGQMSEGY